MEFQKLEIVAVALGKRPEHLDVQTAVIDFDPGLPQSDPTGSQPAASRSAAYRSSPPWWACVSMPTITACPTQ